LVKIEQIAILCREMHELEWLFLRYPKLRVVLWEIDVANRPNESISGITQN
jgi:hypothetical protein